MPIHLDRVETEEVSATTTTTGADLEASGASMLEGIEGLSAAIDEVVASIRPQLETIRTDSATRFGALRSRHESTANESQASAAALSVIAEGESQFQTVLGASTDREAAFEASLLQLCATFLEAETNQLAAPAIAVNERLAQISSILLRQQDNIEQIDASGASSVTAI